MAGEIQLNSTSFASESGGTITINNATVGSAVAMSANQACVKTAINASGSAPIYACRAWVNFNGTGTVAIRDSGNVSSITDNGGSGGDYTVNFATAMPDGNYVVCGSAIGDNSTIADLAYYTGHIQPRSTSDTTTSSLRFIVSRNISGGEADTAFDSTMISVAIFR